MDYASLDHPFAVETHLHELTESAGVVVTCGFCISCNGKIEIIDRLNCIPGSKEQGKTFLEGYNSDVINKAVAAFNRVGLEGYGRVRRSSDGS